MYVHFHYAVQGNGQLLRNIHNRFHIMHIHVVQYIMQWNSVMNVTYLLNRSLTKDLLLVTYSQNFHLFIIQSMNSQRHSDQTPCHALFGLSHSTQSPDF